MIPRWCMVPITVSVVIGGVVYALIMGAITGYFSAAVGMLFVIAGIVGIVSASFSRKALAVFYLIVLIVVNVLALAINIAGVVDPKFLTTMDERDLGFMKIKPSVLWFLGGLLFMAVFCIPCITIGVVNVCIFRPRAPQEKTSRWRFSKQRTADDIEMGKRKKEEGEAFIDIPTVAHKPRHPRAQLRIAARNPRPAAKPPAAGPRQQAAIEASTSKAAVNPTMPQPAPPNAASAEKPPQAPAGTHKADVEEPETKKDVQQKEKKHKHKHPKKEGDRDEHKATQPAQEQGQGQEQVQPIATQETTAVVECKCNAECEADGKELSKKDA